MTKQQYIQQEWAKCLPEDVKWEDVSGYIDSNGRMIKHTFKILRLKLSPAYDFNYDTYFPRGLKNLKTNNGWHRIEDGLPTEQGEYKLGSFYDDEKFRIMVGEYPLTHTLYWLKNGVTHYQLIRPIDPPLY